VGVCVIVCGVCEGGCAGCGDGVGVGGLLGLGFMKTVCGCLFIWSFTC